MRIFLAFVEFAGAVAALALGVVGWASDPAGWLGWSVLGLSACGAGTMVFFGLDILYDLNRVFRERV